MDQLVEWSLKFQHVKEPFNLLLYLVSEAIRLRLFKGETLFNPLRKYTNLSISDRYYHGLVNVVSFYNSKVKQKIGNAIYLSNIFDNILQQN